MSEAPIRKSKRSAEQRREEEEMLARMQPFLLMMCQQLRAHARARMDECSTAPRQAGK